MTMSGRHHDFVGLYAATANNLARPTQKTLKHRLSIVIFGQRLAAQEPVSEKVAPPRHEKLIQRRAIGWANAHTKAAAVASQQLIQNVSSVVSLPLQLPSTRAMVGHVAHGTSQLPCAVPKSRSDGTDNASK
jgi:hypothetical protein